MRLELNLDLILSAVVVAFAIPGWAPMAWRTNRRMPLWRPLSLVTVSFFLQLVFLSAITFGPLTLDYSTRFAALGIPLGIWALIAACKRNVGSVRAGVVISSGLNLLMWLVLTTAH